MKTKLNLGCGKEILENFVNLDINDYKGIDVIWDLNKFPYPFVDNEFKEVIMCQVLEHLYEPLRVMEELVRICKKDAVITITVPHFSDVGAYEEPNHKHYFALNSIEYIKLNCEVIEKELCLHHNIVLKIIGRVFTLSTFCYEHYLHGYFPIKMIKWRLRVRK